MIFIILTRTLQKTVLGEILSAKMAVISPKSYQLNQYIRRRPWKGGVWLVGAWGASSTTVFLIVLLIWVLLQVFKELHV